MAPTRWLLVCAAAGSTWLTKSFAPTGPWCVRPCVPCLPPLLPLVQPPPYPVCIFQSWFYAVNDVLAGTDYPHHARLPAATRSFRSPRFARVYHLVRCPLPHISSFTAHLNASYDFVRRHLLLHISSAPAPPFDESSVWARRNYTRFFQDRVSAVRCVTWCWRVFLIVPFSCHLWFVQVQRAGRGCPRGGRCWLHFAALAWVFWNGHVQRYADALFRVEADLPALVRQAQEDVAGRRAGRPHAPTPSLLGGRPAAPRRPSVKHKAHREYGLSDVAALDAGLAHEVRLLAAALGYRHAGDPEPDPESATTDVPRLTCDEKGGT